MAISDEITRLQNAKSSIKLAIKLKGVEIPDGVTLSYYDEYIAQIKTEGIYETKIVTPNAAGQTVTASEGFDALSQVIINGDLNLIPENIKNGVTIFGVAGTYEVIPNLQSKNITPSASYQEVTPDDGYDGLSSVGVNGDSNLVSDNIKEGISIFGVTGSFAGSGGGSTDYNVFVQTSEPSKKNGIWIKGNADISKGTYFTPDFTKKENFLDENFSYMNTNATIIGQVVVGDYLYSFGTNSENSYAYNIRTRQVIGNLNVPTASVGNKWQAIYYEKLNCIYVVYNSSGLNNPISWYVYYIDSNTSSSVQTKTTGSDTRLSSSCGLNIYNDVIYILHRYYSSSYKCYLQKINAETNTYMSSKNVANNSFDTTTYTQGKYIYWTINGTLYIFDCSTETITSKSIYNSSSSIYTSMGYATSCIVAGDKVYLFSSNTTYYSVYDLSNDQIELKTKNINVPVSWGNNPFAPNLIDGLVYIRNANLNTIAFQIGESGIENYPNNSLLVIQDLSNLKYAKIDNNSGLGIGIKDVYIKENEILENYLSFWGDGEKWNLLKNPTGETAIVTFESAGGSTVSSQEILIGSKVSKPDEPTKDNYIFDNWYLNGEVFDFSIPITDDITLTAHWLTYEVVDYIESSGAEYIDTEIIPINTFSIETEISRKDLSATDGICGSRTSTPIWGMYLYLANSSNDCKYACAYGSENLYISQTSYSDYSKHKIKLELNSTDGLKSYIDDNLVSTNTYSDISNDLNFYLFKCNDGGTSRVSKVKMYSFKIWNNGTLVRDYIPIKRSDGVYALLDQVNNKAYYNAGSGSFTGGKLQEPAQLDYIESTGTQYIDTGILPSTSIKIEADFQYTEIPTEGTYNGCANNNGVKYYFGATANNFLTCVIGSDWSATTVTGVDKERHTVSLANGSQKFDNIQFGTQSISGNNDNTQSIYIFAYNSDWNGVFAHCKIKLYNYKIYDNETLVRDLVPWKDEYGIICLHDTVENKNYYNQGTGEFLGE